MKIIKPLTVMEAERTKSIEPIAKDWSAHKLFYKPNSKDFLDKIHELEVREDDVWIVTYPKCGTTWMQELLWLLINNCEFDTALATDLAIRSPYLEFDFDINEDADKAIRVIQDLPSPRLIKTHLSLDLLPVQLFQKKAKIVYVSRNPIDAWVSGYYHGLAFGFYYGRSLQEYFDKEIMGKRMVKENPIDHFSDFYHIRHEPRLYYTSFERMKSNLRGIIEDVSEFLNKSVTVQQMDRLLKHLSFEEMKNNPTTQHLWERKRVNHPNDGKEDHNFVRRGKVNGYKDELKADQIETVNRILNEDLLKRNLTLEQLLLLNKK